MKNIWFNNLKDEYLGNENSFFSENNSIVEYIESNSSVYRTEINRLLDEKQVEFGEHYAKDMFDDGGWSTICLQTWGISVPENKKKFIELSKITDRFPEIISLSINRLKSGKTINAHTGNTDTIWRFHLGIDIPTGLPECGFKVNGESIAWQNDKAFGFCDAYEHEAWNYSDSDRIIVCFDLIKDEFVKRKTIISFKVRSFLILHFLVSKFPFLLKLPNFILKILLFKIFFLVILVYPYQKYFGVIKNHD